MQKNILCTFISIILTASFTLMGAEISKGSFEHGKAVKFANNRWYLGKWYLGKTDGFVKIVSAFSHSGKRSLCLAPSTYSKTKSNRYWNQFVGARQAVTVKPETLYTVRVWVYSEQNNGMAGVAFRFREKNGNLIKSHKSPIKFLVQKKAYPKWQELVYTISTPKGCDRLDVIAASENLEGKVYFDDFSIREGSDVPAVPYVKKPPVIDGKSAKGEWDGALRLYDFLKLGNAGAKRILAKDKTEVKLLTDNKKLFIRVFCEEKEMGRISNLAQKRDSKVWKDDSIEIFIDPQRSGSSFYQFIINASGAFYDARGTSPGWSPQTTELKTWKDENGWGGEIAISFLELGFGEGEYRNPNKSMALAVFRNRKLKDQKRRASSWLIWPLGKYASPGSFFPINVGVPCKGESVTFHLRGFEQTSLALPLAWKTADPLYEELMSNEPLQTGDSNYFGFIDSARMLYGNQRRNITGFALQHGMKYHYQDLVELLKDKDNILLSFTPAWREFPKEMILKHSLKTFWVPSAEYGGYRFKAKDTAPGIKNKYGSKNYLITDKRVQDDFIKYTLRKVKHNENVIKAVYLGHESHCQFFIHYDKLREAYLKKEPDTWKKFEKETRERYGFGKYSIPKSQAQASPFERIVYHRWVLDNYNDCMKKCAEKLRKNHKNIKIISDIERNGMHPFLYENAVGTYDYIVQQQLYGGGCFRQDVAFGVKLMSDLSSTPVLGGPHIEHYFVSMNEAEANEVISSVFRVGGKGTNLWLVDWFGKTCGDIFGSPRRFNEALNCYRRIRSMKKLIFPKADSAIFFSNYTRFGKFWWLDGGMQSEKYESLFTMLGPHARSWFYFVSDFQLINQSRSLNKFKAVYVPEAEYQDEKSFCKLIDYVKNGGTMILISPDAFKFNIDGTRRSWVPKEIMGIKINGKIKHPGSMRICDSNKNFKSLCSIKKPIPVFSDSAVDCSIISKEAFPLAKFSNGKPAIIVNKLAKGRVITFAAPLLRQEIFGSGIYWRFFTLLQKDIACKTGHNIWRFKFPQAATPASPWPEKSYCFTGNAFMWEYEKSVKGPNLPVKFNLRYSILPDLIPENKEGNNGVWTASNSSLFNRQDSLTATPIKRKEDLKRGLQSWAVAWKNKKEVTITLDFSKSIKANQFRLWVHGDIPVISIGVIKDGTHKELRKYILPKNKIEEVDVREIHIPFPLTQGKNFYIKFDQRDKGALYLGELELWGKL